MNLKVIFFVDLKKLVLSEFRLANTLLIERDSYVY